MKLALFIGLGVFTFGYIFVWIWQEYSNKPSRDLTRRKGALEPCSMARKLASFAALVFGAQPADLLLAAVWFIDLVIGFITDFLDTLGVGSFATTSSMFKLGGNRFPER
jgi:hypothetical protein